MNLVCSRSMVNDIKQIHNYNYKMIIVSWDVGIIHLAYCVMSYQLDDNKQVQSIEILDWDDIDLIAEDSTKLTCCGTQRNGQICGKKARYVHKIPRDNKHLGFCKLHVKQHVQYWNSLMQTKKLFTELSNKEITTCSYNKKDHTTCTTRAKYVYNNDIIPHHYCTQHYRSELKKKTKEYAPQLIKNKIARKYPTAYLQLRLVEKLDELVEHFAKLGVTEVIIENQPARTNPKMKSIAMTLFDYFLIRGYIDKVHQLDIKLVRFIAPCNKLKVNGKTTPNLTRVKKTHQYKLTKRLGIIYTKRLLKNDPQQLKYLSFFSKQDDLCDTYLQGRYYLEYIKNPNASMTSAK